MLGDMELILIGGCGLLWLSAGLALLWRRRRAAAWLGAAAVLSLLTLVTLRAGTGHRG
jgi:hypothetical protein